MVFIKLIGAGANPSDMPASYSNIIKKSKCIVASESLIKSLRLNPLLLIRATGDIDTIAKKIPSHLKEITVLTSGDPLFHSIGSKFIEYYGKENVRVYPNITFLQAAFSRLGMSWDDAEFISLHGEESSSLEESVITKRITAVLTSPLNSPAEIAKRLMDYAKEMGNLKSHIFSNIGGAFEKAVSGRLKSISKKEISDPNVMIIEGLGRKIDTRKFISDSEFLTREALITKEEVRAVALSYLSPKKWETFWDIGAGSGSVGISAGFFTFPGKVYLFEKEQANFEIAFKNLERFKMININLIKGNAPEALAKNIPSPDCVFIGGSAGKLIPILKEVLKRINKNGRIVVSSATIETLNEAVSFFKAMKINHTFTTVNISRKKELAGLSQFKAENPITLVVGRMP